MATATHGDRVYGALKNLKDLSDARELMSLLNYEYDSAPLKIERQAWPTMGRLQRGCQTLRRD